MPTLDRLAPEHPLDNVIRFFLYVMIFWLPYSEGAIESSIIFAIVLWLIKRTLLFVDILRENKARPARNALSAFFPPSTILNRPIAFFVLVCIFSVSGSIFFKESFYGFFTKTLEWFVVYFLVLEVFTKRAHLYIASFIFLFSASAIVLDTLLQFYVTHKDIFRGYVITLRGATASFKHPNQLAGYFTFLTSMGFSFFFWRKAFRPRRIFFLVFFTLTAWASVLTFSRAGWFANIVGVLACAYLFNRKLFKNLFCGAFLLISLAYLVTPMSTKRYLRIEPESITRAANWRLAVWADSLNMVQEAPLFGHGLNTNMRLFEYYRRNSAESGGVGKTYTHNCLIQLTGETGILGGIGFGWILLIFFRKIARLIEKWHVLAQNQDPFFLYLLIGLLGGSVAFLTHSFFDIDLYSLKLSILFWTMIGFGVAIHRFITLDAAGQSR